MQFFDMEKIKSVSYINEELYDIHYEKNVKMKQYGDHIFWYT